MATYAEIYAIAAGGDPAHDALRDKVAVACAIAANGYLGDETATDAQKRWAARAAGDIRGAAAVVYPLVLAANSGASTAAILAANDAAIQAAVDAVTAALAIGLDAAAGA